MPYFVRWVCPECNRVHTEDIERKTPVGLMYSQYVKCPVLGKLYHRSEVEEVEG